MTRQMGKPASEIKSIVKDPAICGGVATLKGTRIRVSDVVVAYDYHDLTPEEIASKFPALGLQDIHAALAYYLSRPEEIREEIREREEVAASRQE